jgi:hypothetical protein
MDSSRNTSLAFCKDTILGPLSRSQQARMASASRTASHEAKFDNNIELSAASISHEALSLRIQAHAPACFALN